MNDSESPTFRLWCSPRADTDFPWKWQVEIFGKETLEFGAEATEEDAKHEASKACAYWKQLLSLSTPSVDRGMHDMES